MRMNGMGGKGALCLALALSLAGGGCVFSPAGKRGNVEDELDTEKEMTLRILDGADAASGLPSLVSLADNAGRMDEVGLRIQALMLIAKTLDSEAALWSGEKAATIRAAARRQADNALREAEDWRRFAPGEDEAVLLVHDARILRARMDSEDAPELEGLLRQAVQTAVRCKDSARAAAWQLALCQIAVRRGLLTEGELWYGRARASFDAMMKTAKPSDPVVESLRLAFAEAKADLAARAGASVQAVGLYEKALERARTMRRRGELKRILLKLAEVSDQAGDPDRAEWYRKRAKGVTKKSSVSAGDRLLGKAAPEKKESVIVSTPAVAAIAKKDAPPPLSPPIDPAPVIAEAPVEAETRRLAEELKRRGVTSDDVRAALEARAKAKSNL